MAISEYMNFMTLNKLFRKLMQGKLGHLLPSQRFITFFSLKISALDIVSGQKSAPRCNQSFSGESARD